jgi:hypothetical protein
MKSDRPLIDVSTGGTVINIFVGDKFDVDTLVDLIKRLEIMQNNKINVVDGRCLND